MERQLEIFRGSRREYSHRLPLRMWNEEDIPGRKFQSRGKKAMTAIELLAIIINSGCRGENAVDIARNLMHRFDNNFDNIATASLKQLCEVKGIGVSKATIIQAALEIGNRRRQDGSFSREKIAGSHDVHDLYRHLFADVNFETFWIVILNRANKVLKVVQVSEGGVSGTVADPKKIFKMALDMNASSVILMHNHPSGAVTPSEADIRLTQKMKDGGLMLDLPVLDHIIFGQDGYYSFADEGQL